MFFQIVYSLTIAVLLSIGQTNAAKFGWTLTEMTLTGQDINKFVDVMFTEGL